MNVTQTISEQGRKPTGSLGRVAARVMPAMFRSLYATVARLLDLQPDDVALDVACGSGTFLKKYAGHVERIAGIDYSDIQVELGRRALRDRISHGSAEIVQGDATALPWADATFSAATCNCVHCFDEPVRSLTEMQRVLVPGGRAVVVMQGDDERGSVPGAVDRWGVPLWSETEVRRMMAEAGFTVGSVLNDKGTWYVTALKAPTAA